MSRGEPRFFQVSPLIFFFLYFFGGDEAVVGGSLKCGGFVERVCCG